MGCRVISLSDYRALKFEANQDISKRPVRVRSKKPPHENLVARAATERNPGKACRRDHTFILMAIFFLSCLALVAFGL
jgi:hypothetical protein